jgi:hypothetical protein
MAAMAAVAAGSTRLENARRSALKTCRSVKSISASEAIGTRFTGDTAQTVPAFGKQ